MTFRITGKNGEVDFEDFNPSSLNNVPLLIRSNTEYMNKYKEEHKDALEEDYRYMQVENETRKVKYDLRVTVGAGLPNNKAFRYNIMAESYGKYHAISKLEYRKYLIKEGLLNVSEIPESETEQRELQIYSAETLQTMQNTKINQGADIAGINSNGNISPNQVKEVYNG